MWSHFGVPLVPGTKLVWLLCLEQNWLAPFAWNKIGVAFVPGTCADPQRVLRTVPVFPCLWQEMAACSSLDRCVEGWLQQFCGVQKA